MLNGLDPDQALYSVGLDLGPNCLQRLSADGTRGQRVVFFIYLQKYIRYFFPNLKFKIIAVPR